MADDRGVVVVGTVAVTVTDPSVAPPASRIGGRGRSRPLPGCSSTPPCGCAPRSASPHRVEILSVRAPANTTVTLRCSASRCPVSTSVAQVGLARANHPLQRTERQLLYAGTLLQVFVTRPGAIGKYVSFRIRPNGPRRGV